MLSWRLITCLALAAILSHVAVRAAPAAPNILLIVADDLGYADVGFNGGKVIRTPNLDRLAATGVRLSRFYACPVCSPTRAGLMTGRWPHRYGLMRAVIPPWSTYGLPADEPILAERLAKAGYARRGIFGKWHLGHARRAMLPPGRGFTDFYGHYNGNIDYFTHRREGEIDWHRDGDTIDQPGYSTDLIGAAAAKFIRESPTGEPWFAYVPFNAPHAPMQAKPADLARYPQLTGVRKRHAAMVDSLDQAIGKVLAAVNERADADNTFVLFMSDNGGIPKHGSNAPLRAGKGTVYEGGVRVCAAVRWPQGGLTGGRTSDEVLGYIDVVPTILAMLGNQPEAIEPPLDGVNMLPALRGEASLARPWFSYIDMGGRPAAAAVMVDPWKLVVKGGEALAVDDENLPQANSVELYNLSNDPAETTDVAADRPETVSRLAAQLRKFAGWRTPGVTDYREGREGFVAPEDWRIEE